MTTSPPDDHVLKRIATDAYKSLSPRQRQRTNLHLQPVVYEPGQEVGPRCKRLDVKRPTILVFADHVPWANFGHDCEYFLYDAQTGSHYESFAARYPPYLNGNGVLSHPFHEPSGPGGKRLFAVEPDELLAADGGTRLRINLLPRESEARRFALLFAGKSDERHLNDLELAYRVLVHRFGFARADIFVLHTPMADVPISGRKWAGDGTPFELMPNGPGTREGVQRALTEIKKSIKASDLLFVFTTGHGDSTGKEGDPVCLVDADGDAYLATQFAEDLKMLEPYHTLMLVAQQCFGGGFIDPIKQQVSVNRLSLAAASRDRDFSYALRSNGKWDSFTWHWFSAQLGKYPDGFDLQLNAGGPPQTSLIRAYEAFAFARDATSANPDDSPQHYPTRANTEVITLR